MIMIGTMRAEQEQMTGRKVQQEAEAAGRSLNSVAQVREAVADFLRPAASAVSVR